MAYISIDKNYDEWIWEEEPTRFTEHWVNEKDGNDLIKLPNGSINRLIGRVLTWNDEPVDLDEEYRIKWKLICSHCKEETVTQKENYTCRKCDFTGGTPIFIQKDK